MNRKPFWFVSVFLVFVSISLSAAPRMNLLDGGVDAAGAEDSGQRVFSSSKQLSVDWWTMFHHDASHTGYSTSIAPSRNTLIWSSTTGGYVYSSPAVVDGKVFIGSRDRKVYAFDASTGFLIWNYTAGASTYTSPAVALGMVFVGVDDGRVYALNASSGSFKWSYFIGIPVYYSSPAVADGKVFIGSRDRKVYALNALTGSFVWSYTTGDYVDSSPAVADGRAFVGSKDKKVYALNASTGALIWNYTTGDSVYSSPAVASGTVFIGSGDGKIYALNASTGSFKWSYLTGGLVYYSSPAVSGGMVFIGSGDSKVYALNASTGSYKWSYTTGGPLYYSSPAVAGGMVFIGSGDGKVYSLNASSGSLIWSYTTGNDVRSSPAVADGHVFVGSLDRKVYAIGSVNRAPIIDTYSPLSSTPSVNEGQSLAFTQTSHDPDSDPLTYKWLLDSVQKATTQNWTYSPDYNSAGTHNVTVVVSDGSMLASHEWNVTVVNVNRAPMIDSFSPINPAPRVNEGQSLAFTQTSHDPDGDPLSYRWLLDSVQRDTTQNWTYSPDFNSAGVHIVIVVVSDGSLSASRQWLVIVVNVNRAPTIDSYYPLTDPTINEGSSQKFNVTYSDPDGDPLTVQWYLNGTPTVTTDSYTFIASPGSAGKYNVTVTVSDGSSQAKHEWTLTIVGHDIAVVNVTLSKTVVGREYFLVINATIENQGNFTETFNVTAYADLIVSPLGDEVTIGKQEVVNLLSAETRSLLFVWNTTGVSYGNYTISVVADTVQGETDTSDNHYTNGTVLITIPGDVNGDKKVDGKDIALMAKYYGTPIEQLGNVPNARNIDVNNDNKIDGKDIAIAAKNFGKKWT